MDEKIKELLEKNLEASQKSLEILQKLRRDLTWRRIYSISKILLVVAILVIGFLQLQPYLNSLFVTLENISEIKKLLAP
ncbi:hypothetical protein A2757_02405 [Candidatus Giovannonibacteria bacterium RIFCSPHIGHO2_01_FULL_48_47]|nr:MAG: hypothetical protein A2757_02405 [Candidatus Giovannonibacteria bacterium RIFCSPHIGHO2_01_FULL_48_47]OGF68613.1 MAG: hypothetical protein A3D61_01755 [Candidatus Giovannonibacteria bacterium RIFCSPHIGHO2_02_FULL_48_15]OGF88499.1 MAG: hypothetical protein A3B26_02110 [Candidatus Giovannonibacteria bacterium RIFCSPLOWO2_01_FULL_48_47]OGF95457.1 MAG: hypothetical protein A2433_00350 [Candidatus Giovannonibacteria bacterium RIFOXYC1_FULL_48_8]OGF96471.1 MAG: hypothetical protein A2613_02870